MDSGRLSVSHEWSRVVSAEVKEEYMTLQGRLQDCSFELDINASQAC